MRYDQVTWVGTHNAYNASAAGYWYANQTYGIARQLDDGVRALMLDVWEADGQLVLRHGKTFHRLLGQRPLADTLTTLRKFLDDHPSDIVTLIFESYVDENSIAKAFREAGLLDVCYAHAAGEEWPTLDEMIDTNRRLVVFSDRASGRLPWYMPVWEHCHETHWEAARPADLLENRPGRGDPANPLWIANHFLQNRLKQPSVARTVNESRFLEKRFGVPDSPSKKPNFLVVDFYEEGDVLSFTDRCNTVRRNRASLDTTQKKTVSTRRATKRD